MQNVGKSMSSIILAGQCLLVKMLITLEPHGIFQSNFAYQYIITLSKTVIRLRHDFFVAKPSHRFALLCLDNVIMY